MAENVAVSENKIRRRWKKCLQNRNYIISDDGLCKSAHYRFDGRFLTPARRKHCDVYVLCDKYYKHAYPIRHLVYSAFKGPVPKGWVVYNKNGDIRDNHLENLAIMPLCDKLFYFAKRKKKIPRKALVDKYTFEIGGKIYNTYREVSKDYSNLGTRQNLYYQADRWIRREAARGKSWSADGFMIRGTLIKAYRERSDNAVKKRMDLIVANYEIQKGKKR